MSLLSSFLTLYGSRAKNAGTITNRQSVYKDQISAYKRNVNVLNLKERKEMAKSISEHNAGLANQLNIMANDASNDFQNKRIAFDRAIQTTPSDMNYLPLLAGKSSDDLVRLAKNNLTVAKLLASDAGKVICEDLDQKAIMQFAAPTEYSDLQDAYDYLSGIQDELPQVIASIEEQSQGCGLSLQEERALDDMDMVSSLSDRNLALEESALKKQAERQADESAYGD